MNSEKVVVKYAFFSPSLGMTFQIQNQDMVLVDTDGSCDSSSTLIRQYTVSTPDDDEEDEVPPRESVIHQHSPKKV